MRLSFLSCKCATNKYTVRNENTQDSLLNKKKNLLLVVGLLAHRLELIYNTEIPNLHFLSYKTGAINRWVANALSACRHKFDLM